MSKAVNDKWKKIFPDTIGNQVREKTGVDDTLEFETGAFPRVMANDPVRYDLQNASMSQAMSNDARLKEQLDKQNSNLDIHKKDPEAHAAGIAGNAASATKLQTARNIKLAGKATGTASFNGTADATVNVTAVVADTTVGNSGSATKLQTVRNIKLTGKATGSASFDGTADASINVTAVTADKCTGNSATATNVAWNGVTGKPATYPPAPHTHAYLPTAGGTMTGNIAFSAIGNTATSNKLSWNGAADGADIYYQITASDQGNLVLNLRDDDNCYLRIAKNGAFKSYFAPADGSFHGNTAGKHIGNIQLPSGSWNAIGDDVYIGDYNVAGSLCVKGTNGTTGITLFNRSNESDRATISYAGENLAFNKTLSANITGNSGSTNVAKTLGKAGGTSGAMKFNWSGQNGQPTWLWGGNDGTNMYVYNPKNFTVNSAASATNADKLDGAHLADIYRRVGGRNQPSMTALMDRTAMCKAANASAAEINANIAKINKSRNWTQSIWNDSTGIRAYGGDFGFKDYRQGTVLLNQDFRNFDRIMFFFSNDDGNHTHTITWDSWELWWSMQNSWRLSLCKGASYGGYWDIFGSNTALGTDKHSNKYSSPTVLQCYGQDCGIIEIYGLNY